MATKKIKSKTKTEEKESKKVKKSTKQSKKEKTQETSKTKKTKSNTKASKTPKSKSTKSAKSVKKALSMADLLEKNQDKIVVPKKGDSISGVITSKDKKALRIDVGAKTEAVVTDKEFEFAKDYIDGLKVGETVEAVVVSSENSKGQLILSLKGSANDSKWQFFEEALEEEKNLEAKGLEVNKGGLIAVVNGVRGFVPSSQFGRKYVGKIHLLKGKTFEVRVIEVDREKNRLIFSERHVSEAKQLAQKDQALSVVKEGAVYEGVVSGIMPFGLFVTVEIPIDQDKKDEKNIGYIEGLVHISEISWKKVNHPKDYHNVGDRIKVKILGIDEKTAKLNLSIKQIKEDPWAKIVKEYEVGSTFQGKVSRIEPFGVFVNVKPGVDGLIHASKLNPGQDFKIGDEVTVNVESIDQDQRRMSLSVVLTEVPMGYK
ncbi:MAG: S1 RNA-binding domain-containing protein [Candidatus Woesebacteria bacterium]|jgi:ribosomal protein S1